MDEIWEDIIGFEGIYQVSNLGNIKNVKTNKLLKPLDRTKEKRLVVQLCKKYKHTVFSLSKLVADLFVSNTCNCSRFKYKDNDYHNCSADNLQWIIPKPKLTPIEKAKQIILCRQLGIIAYSQTEMCNKLKTEGYIHVAKQCINNCLLGKSYHHMGLTFIDIKKEIIEGISIDELVAKYYEDKINRNRFFFTPLPPSICIVEGCDNKPVGFGFCVKHYVKFKRYGDPLFVKPPMHIKSCLVKNCEEKACVLGYCHKHYERIKRLGTPFLGLNQQQQPKEKISKIIKEKAKKLSEEKVCSVKGCNKTNVVKYGNNYYCHLHRDRIFYWGDPYGEKEGGNNPNNNICLVDGCEEASLTGGYCFKHLNR